MKVKPPSPPSAQSVQTKKKPPGDLARSPSVAGLGSGGRNRPGGGSDARPPFPRDVRRRQEHYVSGSRGGVPMAEPPQPHRRQSRGRRGGPVHGGNMDRRGFGDRHHDL